MAVNSVSISESGTTEVAVDTIGGVQYPIQKIALGADDALDVILDSGQQTMANSLPVVLASNQAAIPVTGGGGTEYAEDSAHVSGDLGKMALGVRKDTAAAVATSDGDYSPFQVTATGALRVALAEDAVGSILDADSVAKVTLNTKYIAAGATDCVPKFVKIAAASNGNNTILAAVSGKKIRVLAYNFIANGTVNAKFQDGAGGTDLTGLKYCVVNTGICAPFNPVGWFETSATMLLNVNLSSGTAIGGELVYIEV